MLFTTHYTRPNTTAPNTAWSVTEPETKSKARCEGLYLQSVASRSVGNAPGHTVIGVNMDDGVATVWGRASWMSANCAISKSVQIGLGMLKLRSVGLGEQTAKVVVQQPVLWVVLLTCRFKDRHSVSIGSLQNRRGQAWGLVQQRLPVQADAELVVSREKVIPSRIRC